MNWQMFEGLNETDSSILNENDIIKLIQEKMNETDKNDESEKKLELISFGDAIKSLTKWITFFEQQQLDEFRTKDMDVFNKYLSLTQQLAA
ncbi:hypothetical protein GLOIN_2v1478522 [Rhizophagus clarus]|uniref:Uncharacterized protein n=1 Tax=Rhizophagus clarus TaxID=94130 RepID=A0A8H3KT28_9GLOM|nr:hypothetical protein GLOIN_2v1478522 [Rhizophagus clarus]